MKKILVYAGSLMLLPFLGFAQDFKMPAPSPTAKVEQQFSTSFINIDYSRPSKKGRAIFGDLVPYNKIWRTGANANTKFTFGEEVYVEGQKVPAGTYSVYTIPGQGEWTVVLNKGTENWGTAGYNQAEDAAKFVVKPLRSQIVCETFTIEVADITSTSATINMIWDNVIVPISIKADNNQRILRYLEQELNGPKPPFQQAANYYLENNIQLDKALTYAEKAIDGNKEAFWLHWLKAKILAQLGKQDEAIKAAQMAADLTKGTDYETEYMNNVQKLKEQFK